MIKPTDFHRMWIGVNSHLLGHLVNGKVLTCSHEQVQFVLTAEAEIEQAQAVRAGLVDHRPAYVLPVTPAVAQALAAGETIEVRVLDGAGEKAGSLRLAGGERQEALRTEHGDQKVVSILASQLDAGDFFAISERTRLSRRWVVYRALTKFDDGQVRAQRTAPDKEPSITVEGEGQVVYLITDRSAMLAKLGWDDVTPTAR
jgi:hypothetical protein